MAARQSSLSFRACLSRATGIPAQTQPLDASQACCVCRPHQPEELEKPAGPLHHTLDARASECRSGAGPSGRLPPHHHHYHHFPCVGTSQARQDPEDGDGLKVYVALQVETRPRPRNKMKGKKKRYRTRFAKQRDWFLSPAAQMAI